MADVTLKFSKSELDAIEGALKHLLDAELLAENGYTEEVVEALNSSLSKIHNANKLAGIFGNADLVLR